MVFTFINNSLDMVESKLSIYSTVIISIIVAIVVVFVATKKFTVASGVITILIAGLLYLLASATRGTGMENSLPTVGYPVPPHLGLGGVSLQNHYPNKVGYGV
jgi:hypothetical protein